MRRRLNEGRVEAELRAVEKCREFGESKRQAFGGSGAQGDMAEFPARPGDFSVKVQMRVGHREDFRRFRKVANQIKHRAVAGRAC